MSSAKERGKGCVNKPIPPEEEKAQAHTTYDPLFLPFLCEIYLQLADESAPDLRQWRLHILEVGGGRHEVRHLEGGGGYLYDVHKVFRLFILDPISQYGIHITSHT